MDNKILVEVCCGSADDVIEAERGGADRAELNSALFLGGLTPTPGALIAARRNAAIPIFVMIRPRAGGFCYTEMEFESMLYDLRALLEAGADGVVFGCLHPDGTVDAGRCRALVQAAGGKPCVFHRAIDVVPDWREALETIIGLGFMRVLTSGQQPSAPLGARTISAMREQAAGRIEILPGAGIRPQNAAQLLRDTGCRQLHLSAGAPRIDPSAVSSSSAIHFGGALYPAEDSFQVVDPAAVERIRAEI